MPSTQVQKDQRRFPGLTWEKLLPDEAGFDPEKLNRVKDWIENSSRDRKDDGYRVVVVRHGALVAEWNRNVEPDEQRWLASATKSIYSCMLGIAIQEDKIESADSLAVDIYPQMMEVPEGNGPKPGRYAFEKDRAITLRQLISNTSGYMKPDEEPGKVFHYQTYGMNILSHAIAAAYEKYDPDNPEGSPGLSSLIDSRIREPIGAQWDYYLTNFALQPEARLNIFGYYEGVKASALDMARLGWLWCCDGEWEGKTVVPQSWLRQAVQVAPAIRQNEPEEKWQYGYGFWTNEAGQIWPGLPRDSFAASGAGRKHIWVCPSLDLVVAQSPGPYGEQEELGTGLLGRLLDALTDA